MPRNGLELHYEVEDICTLRCIFIGTHILHKGRPGRRYITNSNEAEAWRFLSQYCLITCEDSSADTVICRKSQIWKNTAIYMDSVVIYRAIWWVHLR
jgi:hypothetical protein